MPGGSWKSSSARVCKLRNLAAKRALRTQWLQGSHAKSYESFHVRRGLWACANKLLYMYLKTWIRRFRSLSSNLAILVQLSLICCLATETCMRSYFKGTEIDLILETIGITLSWSYHNSNVIIIQLKKKKKSGHRFHNHHLKPEGSAEVH